MLITPKRDDLFTMSRIKDFSRCTSDMVMSLKRLGMKKLSLIESYAQHLAWPLTNAVCAVLYAVMKASGAR
jgi:hypothetical protein